MRLVYEPGGRGTTEHTEHTEGKKGGGVACVVAGKMQEKSINPQQQYEKVIGREFKFSVWSVISVVRRG